MYIGEAALIPDTVIEFDVTTVFSAAPVTSVKENGLGVVSEGDDEVVVALA